MKIQEKTLINSSQTPSQNQAWVVGMEAICSSGEDKQSIFENLFTKKSSVNPSGLAPIESQTLQNSSSSQVHFEELVPPSLQVSRCLPWFYLVVKKALEEANWSKTQGIGVIYATTTSSVDLWQSELPFIKSPASTEVEVDEVSSDLKVKSLVRNQSLGLALDKITEHFLFDGPQALVTSSCSASLQALALGTLWVETGVVEKCLIVTTEVLCNLTQLGFDSIRLLTKNICKPFDKNRTGINLGEAAAAICLQSSKTVASNQKKWGRISGVGFSSDAYHTTSPHPEGRGSALAIQMALQKAQLKANEIDWIYAHGTASPGNDLAEMKAFRQVFDTLPYVVSTKSFHGHTLAASGLLESVIGFMALDKNKILINSFTESWDPAFEVTPLSAQALKENLEMENRSSVHILKNSLGFGGINVSVVLSRN